MKLPLLPLLLSLLATSTSAIPTKRMTLDDLALEDLSPVHPSLSRRFNLDDLELDELRPVRPLGKRADDVSLGHSLNLAWSSKATSATLTAEFNATNERVINLDAFSAVVSSMDCRPPELALDFVDEAAFRAAIAAWDWVHEHDDRHFIMVVDSPKCGATASAVSLFSASPKKSSGWVPYNITDVRYDTDNWIAYLTAEEISYQSAIRHGHLTIETFTLPETTNSSIATRASVSKDIDLANSYKGSIVNLPLDEITSLNLECTDCSTAGTAQLRLDVDISWFKVKRAALTLTATDVVADVNLALDATAKQSLSGTQELWSVQALGVSIPGIAKLGFGPEVGIGWGASVAGEGAIGWGARGTLTPHSTATLCFAGCETGSEGWEVEWTPTTPSINGTVGVDVDVSTYLTLSAAASVFSLGYEGGIALVAPSFKGKFEGLASTAGGVCGGDDAAVMGIQSSIQLGAEAYAYLGASHIKTDERWDFFNAYAKLLDECVTL